MRVIFKTVKFKNLLSTGNSFTEIDLQSSERNLIIGKNGSGKSTFIEALVFALYNQAYRKINKPDLVNSINKKDCLVELEFEILGVPYKIIRGIKPAIFEIYCRDEKMPIINMTEQQELLEKSILKMNYKTFTQVVVLGTAAFIPFMDLNAASRREVNESLLDLQIFSVMNTLLKGKNSLITQEISHQNTIIAGLENQRAILQRQLEKISQENADSIAVYEEQLQNWRTKKIEQEKIIEETQSVLKSFIVPDLVKLEKKKSTLIGYVSTVNEKINVSSSHINFFDKNDICPTCSQSIEPNHKQEMIQKYIDEVEQLIENKTKIQQGLTDSIAHLMTAEEKMNEWRTLNQKITQAQTSLTYITKNIEQCTNSINSLQGQDSSLVVTKKELEKTDLLLEQEKQLLARNMNTKSHYTAMEALLKDDGIKASIINKYIPIINAQVNAYLSAMNFYVGFEMDRNFEVVFKSRFRDAFSYPSFSQGQRSRIDLALLLTWRDIAKMKNSVSTNLLILDEVFDSSLDTEGSETLISIMKTLTNQNIWVVSHKDLYQDKFDKVYRFVLENNFSTMRTEK